MDKKNEGKGELPPNLRIYRSPRNYKTMKAPAGQLVTPQSVIPVVGKEGAVMGKPCSDAKDSKVESVSPGKGEGDCAKTSAVSETGGQNSIGGKEDGKVDDAKNGQNTTKPKKKKTKKKTFSVDSSNVTGETTMEKEQRSIIGNSRDVHPSRGRGMHQSDAQFGKQPSDGQGETDLPQKSGNASSHPGAVGVETRKSDYQHQQRRLFSGDSRHMRGNYRRNDEQRRSDFSRSGNADGSSEGGTKLFERGRVFFNQRQNRGNHSNHRGIGSNRQGHEQHKGDSASIECGKVAAPEEQQIQPQHFHKQYELRNHSQTDSQRDVAAVVECKTDASDDNPQTLQHSQILSQPALENQNNQQRLTSSGSDRKNAPDNQSRYQLESMNYRRTPYNPRQSNVNQRDQPNDRDRGVPDYQRKNYGNQGDSRVDGRNPNYQRQNYGNQRDPLNNRRSFNDHRQNYQNYRDSTMQKTGMPDNQQHNDRSQHESTDNRRFSDNQPRNHENRREPMDYRRFPDSRPRNYGSQREPMDYRRFPDNQLQNNRNQRDQMDNRVMSDNQRQNYGNHRDILDQRGREYPSTHGPGSFYRRNYNDSKRDWDNRRDMGYSNQRSGTMKGSQHDQRSNYPWPGAFSDKRDTAPTDKDLQYIVRWLDGQPKSNTTQPEKQTIEEEEEEDDWDAPKKPNDSSTQISSVELPDKTDDSDKPLETVDTESTAANADEMFAPGTKSSQPGKKVIEKEEEEDDWDAPKKPDHSSTQISSVELHDESDKPLETGDIASDKPLETGDIASDKPLETGDTETDKPLETVDTETDKPLETVDTESDKPPQTVDTESTAANADEVCAPGTKSSQPDKQVIEEEEEEDDWDAPKKPDDFSTQISSVELPDKTDESDNPLETVDTESTATNSDEVCAPGTKLKVSISPTKDGCIPPAMDVSVRPATEVSIRPAMEISIPPVKEVSIRPALDVSIRPAMEISVPTAKELSTRQAMDISIRPAMEIAIPPVKEVSIRPALDVSIRPAMEVSVPTTKELSTRQAMDVSIRPAMEISIPPVKEVSIRPALDVSIRPAMEISIPVAKEVSIHPAMDISTPKIQQEIQNSAVEPEQSASETVKEMPVRPDNYGNLSGPGFLDLEEIYRELFEKDSPN